MACARASRPRGTATDPVSGDRFEIRAPFAGTILGLAHPQVVLPDHALFPMAPRE
jgi:hypothetical protein